MKKAGIALIILQLISFIPAIINGDNIFANGIANLFGRCLFGIVGVILLVVAAVRKSR